MEADAEAAAAEVLRRVASGASAHAVLSLPAAASAADVRTRYKQARPVELLCLCAHASPAGKTAAP